MIAANDPDRRTLPPAAIRRTTAVPLKLLFIHKNFPAQFGALGTWLSAQGHDVTFATERDVTANVRFRIVRYAPNRAVRDTQHPYLASTEQAVLASQGFARRAVEMRAQGYVPDIVVAHTGWGGGTFAKEVWPTAKLVSYLEWYYHWPPADRTPHDPADDDTLDRAARTRARNLPLLLDFSAADATIVPTRFQAAQMPAFMADRIWVHHDGIDCGLCSAGDGTRARTTLGIPDTAEVLTWVTRGMEPARGFPEMIAALAALQRARPSLHAIIVGEDRVAYGARSGPSWKDRALADHPLDMSRVHFTGLVSKPAMIDILAAGTAHLYLTAPFVLSWSMLEAMAAGVTLVASDVAPVQEFADNGVEALLAPTYDHARLVAVIAQALDGGGAGLGAAAARRVADTLDAARIVYPQKLAFFEGLIGG